MTATSHIAVLDVGKTNVKLNVVTADGTVLDCISTPNPSRDGPPWRHHDLAATSEWLFTELARCARQHPIDRFIATGHGSGGILTTDDPDASDSGTALPMIDYEQPLPGGLDAAYAPLSGSFFDRGSAVMMAATHQARQLFWMARTHPVEVAHARWYLGIPQYWGWRLSGVAVSEVSILGAQSHLWNVPEARWAPIVRAQGWHDLMPPFAPAWADLGPIRPDLARRHGLPAALRIHAGLHDSSANFYRYQAAGLSNFIVVSTGTWIVAIADNAPLNRLDETRGMTCNADIEGRPLGGALTMGGREFVHVAGPQPEGAVADPATLARLIAQGTMALPSFGTNDGQFPGTASQGRIIGAEPADRAERLALAVLYTALLTCECIGALGTGTVILDGTFLRDPLYPSLVAALRPDRETLFAPGSSGIAGGAALVCSHPGRQSPVNVLLQPAVPAPLPNLDRYVQDWRMRVGQPSKGTTP